jgi:hypothetical protein
LAEYFDITVGDLLEGLVLHAFDAKAPPFGEEEEQLHVIEDLKQVYGLDASASHRLIEREAPPSTGSTDAGTHR